MPQPSSSEFVPPSDSFGRTAVLGFERTFPVLGVPLQVRSNAARVLDLATSIFGAWARLPSSCIEAAECARLDVIVQASTDDRRPGRMVYRRHGPVLLGSAGRVLASVLIEQRHGVAFVPAQVLDHEEWFTHHVLGLGWLTVTQHHRVPLHAGGIARDGQALLLLGRSGLGKSTLTYACRRAGFDVLGEDTVFVDLGRPTARLWGSLSHHWLAPDAVAFFPEIASHPPVIRGNGKTRRQVPADDGATPPLLMSECPVTSVLLSRRAPAPALASIEPDEVARVLESDDTEGFDQYPAERPAVLEWLRTRPAYRLEVGHDPHLAAALLRRLVETSAGPTGTRGDSARDVHAQNAR